ncbi:hypothetical protein BSI_30880 [Bacillus inaquosorum KCTC 13429]|uniref:Uncharacterized protein n=1 Tax=Bacillus inaquosorum KCTC 13429 TaxID=1236548 RepID=A0A9W5LH84_9BACI|nr:hypothetical protein BSI_30880 [Bacillus inaquosorum KCTC 13429]
MDKGLKTLLIKWINSEYFVDNVYKALISFACKVIFCG